MSQTPNASGFLIFAAVMLAAAFAVAALVGGRTEIGTREVFDYVPANHADGAAIVVDKIESEPLTIFGIEFGQSEYQVSMSFTVAGDCFTALGEETEWPVSSPECAGPGGMVGAVNGLGRSADGQTILIVAVEVSEDCFQVVELGARWDSPPINCR